MHMIPDKIAESFALRNNCKCFAPLPFLWETDIATQGRTIQNKGCQTRLSAFLGTAERVVPTFASCTNQWLSQGSSRRIWPYRARGTLRLRRA